MLRIYILERSYVVDVVVVVVLLAMSPHKSADDFVVCVCARARISTNGERVEPNQEHRMKFTLYKKSRKVSKIYTLTTHTHGND